MTVLDAMPANPNPLKANGFRFWVRKLPILDFFVQKAFIPPVSLPSVKTPNPFISVPLTGDHIEHDELTLIWLVDENAGSIIELYNWIRGAGYPESWDQYKELYDQPEYSGLGLRSEANLIVLDSKKRANFQYVFQDLSPTYLSTTGLELDSNGITYVTATARFSFTDYTIESAVHQVDNG